MTSKTWDFMQPDPQELFNKTIGETLARIVRIRWPHHTAKHVARHWNLDATTAANVIRGSASERTIAKAIRADGWALLAPLGEALTGQSYEAHLSALIEETRIAHERATERKNRHAALVERAALVADLQAGRHA